MHDTEQVGVSHPDQKETHMYSLALHGGGIWLDKLRAPRADYEASLLSALRFGLQMLASNRSALDTVEAVVALLEDDPLYKAGRGSVADLDQMVTMDASIMEGRSGRYGAVATLRRVRNPIKLARHLLDNRVEKMIAGEGAEKLAQAIGLRIESRDYFCVPTPSVDKPFGTVGAVAADQAGNLASASSTGGFPGHQVNECRVGDTPIIGAGTLADNRSCAISTCGHGERFIERGVTRRIAGALEFTNSRVQEVVTEHLGEVSRFSTTEPVVGGVICVAPTGEFGIGVTSSFKMAFACGDARDDVRAGIAG